MALRVSSKHMNRLFEKWKGANVFDRRFILNGTAKPDVIFRVAQTTTFKEDAWN